MLKISIVIPAYNEEAYLADCLQAINKQTIAPDEVIVVDNNSTDKTAEIARQFPFVRLVNEPKQGLFHSRNHGMDLATGDVIGRIDADTVIDPHWVEVLHQRFASKKVFAASGPVGYHDMPAPEFTKRAEHGFLKLAKFANYQFLMGANMAVRRSAWQDIKQDLCDETYIFEDIDIAVHLVDHGMLPSYEPNMSALVSSRRFVDKPVDFMRYIRGHKRTHGHHDLKAPPGAIMAQSIFMLVYFGVKPLHMLYDPKLRRPSLRYLLKGVKPRPDPMNVK